MNKEHKTTLAIIFAGWLGACLACSEGNTTSRAVAEPTPTDMTLPAYNPTHPYTDPAAAVYIKNMWNEGHLRPPDRNKDIPPGMRPMTEAEVDKELRKRGAR